MEPARDLKTNMKISYTGLVPNDEYLEDCRDPALFKKLTFSYVFFHAIIQCRVLFGPIGWNKPYKFTNEDLESCLIQLKGLINKYKETPWKVINYLGATINYGGRVTQNLDKRLCENILINYMQPKAIEDNYKYSKSGVYKVLKAGKHADYVNYIQSLPLNTLPEVYGLHDNAEISNA